MKPYRRVALPFPGRLYLTCMPGFYRDVDVHTKVWPSLAAGSTDRVVLCLVDSKTRDRSTGYRKFLEAIGKDTQWEEFPVRNRLGPEDNRGFVAVIDRLIPVILNDRGLVILHCAAGIGRTGMTAASLLIRMGLDLDDSLERVRMAGSGPETPWQMRVVRGMK